MLETYATVVSLGSFFALVINILQGYTFELYKFALKRIN